MPNRSSETPAERSLRGRTAVLTSWANTADWTARTAPGRTKFEGRFDRQVDPDGVLPPHERAKRAAMARRAYFTELARKSAAARRKRTQAAA
jgi:hypothetical protein